MFGDYQLSLHDYLSILRRRALVMILVFGGVLTIAVVFIFTLPRVYESTATILVEGPQVQVAATEGAARPRPEDRVNLIRQRLMTRENLVRVAGEHQLFTGEDGKALSDTDIVNAMRQSIRIDLMGGAGDPWAPRPASVSFNLSFQYGEPEKALEVTQELADLFLSSNRQDRVDQASRTTDFLSGEAERVRKELESLEAQIATFKSQHGGSLPDSSAVTLGGLPALEADLRNAERDYRLAVSELRTLEVELNAARRGVTASGVVAASPPTQPGRAGARARTHPAGRVAGHLFGGSPRRSFAGAPHSQSGGGCCQ